MQDRLSAPKYGSVRLNGLLGSRLEAWVHRVVTHNWDYLLWPYEQGQPVVPFESTAERYYDEVAPLREPHGEHSWLYPRGMAPRPELTVSDWQGELIGTWLGTASVMAHGTADPRLLEKIERLLTGSVGHAGP